MKNKRKLLSVSAGLASVALLASLNAGQVKAAEEPKPEENQTSQKFSHEDAEKISKAADKVEEAGKNLVKALGNQAKANLQAEVAKAQEAFDAAEEGPAKEALGKAIAEAQELLKSDNAKDGAFEVKDADLVEKVKALAPEESKNTFETENHAAHAAHQGYEAEKKAEGEKPEENKHESALLDEDLLHTVGVQNAGHHDLHHANAGLKELEAGSDKQHKDFDTLEKLGYVENELPSDEVLSEVSKQNAEEHDIHFQHELDKIEEESKKDHEAIEEQNKANDELNEILDNEKKFGYKVEVPSDEVLSEVGKENASHHDLHHENSAKFAEDLATANHAAHSAHQGYDFDKKVDEAAKEHEDIEEQNKANDELNEILDNEKKFGYEVAVPSDEVLSEVSKQNAEEHDLHAHNAKFGYEVAVPSDEVLSEVSKQNAEEHDIHFQHELDKIEEESKKDHEAIVEQNKANDELNEILDKENHEKKFGYDAKLPYDEVLHQVSKHNAEEHDIHAQHAVEAGLKELQKGSDKQHEGFSYLEIKDLLPEVGKQNAAEHDLHHENAKKFGYEVKLPSEEVLSEVADHNAGEHDLHHALENLANSHKKQQKEFEDIKKFQYDAELPSNEVLSEVSKQNAEEHDLHAHNAKFGYEVAVPSDEVLSEVSKQNAEEHDIHHENAHNAKFGYEVAVPSDEVLSEVSKQNAEEHDIHFQHELDKIEEESKKDHEAIEEQNKANDELNEILDNEKKFGYEVAVPSDEVLSEVSKQNAEEHDLHAKNARQAELNERFAKLYERYLALKARVESLVERAKDYDVDTTALKEALAATDAVIEAVSQRFTTPTAAGAAPEVDDATLDKLLDKLEENLNTLSDEADKVEAQLNEKEKESKSENTDVKVEENKDEEKVDVEKTEDLSKLSDEELLNKLDENLNKLEEEADKVEAQLKDKENEGKKDEEPSDEDLLNQLEKDLDDLEKQREDLEKQIEELNKNNAEAEDEGKKEVTPNFATDQVAVLTQGPIHILAYDFNDDQSAFASTIHWNYTDIYDPAKTTIGIPSSKKVDSLESGVEALQKGGYFVPKADYDEAHKDVLLLGWPVNHPEGEGIQTDSITHTFKNVVTPKGGQVFVFDGTAENPVALLGDPATDDFEINQNDVLKFTKKDVPQHANFLFTEPGEYVFTIESAVKLAGKDDPVVASATYTFAVGDEAIQAAAEAAGEVNGESTKGQEEQPKHETDLLDEDLLHQVAVQNAEEHDLHAKHHDEFQKDLETANHAAHHAHQGYEAEKAAAKKAEAGKKAEAKGEKKAAAKKAEANAKKLPQTGFAVAGLSLGLALTGVGAALAFKKRN